MRPVPGVAVTLVNEAAVVPYSAMVPAHIAGDYTADEISIDLVRLCQSRKVRFVAERVTRLDPVQRHIFFADRPPLTCDALSVGLGSLPACPLAPTPADASLSMRPLGSLIQKLDALDEKLRQGAAP